MSLESSKVAVVVCDMWDRHWSAGASRRVEQLAPKIDGFCTRLRETGALIVHAPSDTMPAYETHPARRRVATSTPLPLPPAGELPRLPVDASDGGSDTEDSSARDTRVWSRQHPAVTIDPDCDIITDDGGELAGYLRETGRDSVLMTGVHTNMCVLNRTFGLVSLTAMGFRAALVADLTDAMYNPARPPYVDHDAGTALVIRYIEAFVCPSTTSGEVEST